MPDNQDANGGRPSGYAQALALGFVSGLRAMLGPAFLAETASATVKAAFRLLAAGELVADKLPQTPNRIDPGPLLGRIISGAAVGGIVCRRARQSLWVGMLLGGGAAVAGAFGGYYGRKALGAKLHLPDPLVAVAEDALAVGLVWRFRP